MRLLRRSMPPLLVLLAAACGSEPAVAPTEMPARLTHAGSSALVPLDPFGIGEKMPGSRGCQAAAYRQFDFWVGDWQVSGALGGAPTATSNVTSDLDGCVVLEHWRPFGGGRGRSLNAYDASTGRWSQMWVAAGGCPFANIFMEGGLDGTAMDMSGTRAQPLGFVVQCPPPPVVVFSRTDHVRWTPLPGGAVLQQSVAANDGAPLLPITPPPAGGGLVYEPRKVDPPGPSDNASFCQFRTRAREFDFMIGTWDVHQGNGEGAQGVARFSKDLTNCLVEERFSGPAGYEGLSFNTYDAFTQRWVRTYVDNDAQRLFMTGGGLGTGGSMVLRGTKAGSAHRSIEVRITWTPVEPTRVEQRWEYSRDAGASWDAGQVIVYTKQQPPPQM
jgi:hypothetical protein